MIADITGFATQGEGYERRYWTVQYTLEFSRDGINYFADTPPLDTNNAPSDEDRRVVIRVLIVLSASLKSHLSMQSNICYCCKLSKLILHLDGMVKK